MSFCPFFSLVAYSQNTPDTVVMKRVRCGSWQCSHCARENRRLWAAHLKRRLPQVSDNWWFVTITAHEDYRTPENSLENIRSNIDRLFKRLRRIYAKIQYVRVFEVHEKGAFHAHLVISGLSDRVQKGIAQNGIEFFRETQVERGKGNWSIRTWFRRSARQMGMGFMVDVQRVYSCGEVVKYIVKYLTKKKQDFLAKNLRRVQTTQQIGGLRSRGSGDWKIAARVFRASIPAGGRLYDADKKLSVPDDYWKENLTYPRPGD